MASISIILRSKIHWHLVILPLVHYSQISSVFNCSSNDDVRSHIGFRIPLRHIRPPPDPILSTLLSHGPILTHPRLEIAIFGEPLKGLTMYRFRPLQTRVVGAQARPYDRVLDLGVSPYETSLDMFTPLLVPGPVNGPCIRVANVVGQMCVYFREGNPDAGFS